MSPRFKRYMNRRRSNPQKSGMPDLRNKSVNNLKTGWRISTEQHQEQLLQIMSVLDDSGTIPIGESSGPREDREWRKEARDVDRKRNKALLCEHCPNQDGHFWFNCPKVIC